MTSSADQPRHPRRLRWAALLTAALASAIAAPLLSMKDDAMSLVAIAVALISGAAAWLATARLRPWSRTSAWALLIAVVIAFVSSVGMKSLWLSAYGEPTISCVVTKESSHTPRRSPTHYWNDLNCGTRQVTYRPSPSYSTKRAGERIDLVIDRTGLAGYAEPGTIKPAISAVVGIAVLAALGFLAAVLWWHAKKPKKRPDKPKLQRGFL